MGILDSIVESELGVTESDKAVFTAAAQDVAHVTATFKALMPRFERIVAAGDLLAQRLAQKGTT
jgi:hypothetical protein